MTYLFTTGDNEQRIWTGRPAVSYVNSMSLPSAALSVGRFPDASHVEAAMPGKIRAFVYDAAGNPTGVSELTTDDPTGARGFDASTASALHQPAFIKSFQKPLNSFDDPLRQPA
ncbi:hypothetical protein [Paraburkholderia sp. 2C]